MNEVNGRRGTGEGVELVNIRVLDPDKTEADRKINEKKCLSTDSARKRQKTDAESLPQAS